MDENKNLEIVMGEEAAVVTPVPTDAKKVNQYLAIGSGIIIGAGALYLAYQFLIKPAITKAKAKKAEVTPIDEKKPEGEKKEET